MKKTSAASLGSLGGLSPNISSYIQSLWYPSGAEPVLALGTGSSGLKLQIIGEQQKFSLWGYPCTYVLAGGWRPKRAATALQGEVWMRQQPFLAPAGESHLPLPPVVNKLISAKSRRNFAPSMVEQFTFKSSKKQRARKNSGTCILQQVEMRLLWPVY